MIVIQDDDEAMRKLMLTFLRQAGRECSLAKCGRLQSISDASVAGCVC